MPIKVTKIDKENNPKLVSVKTYIKAEWQLLSTPYLICLF